VPGEIKVRCNHRHAWNHLVAPVERGSQDYMLFVRNDRMLSTLTVEDTSVFVAGQTLTSELPLSYTLLACALVWRNLVAFATISSSVPGSHCCWACPAFAFVTFNSS
jgi:hypothetical protein